MTDWIEIGPCKLACGDSLEILPEIEAGSIDCVVTDPPYMIGANSIGNAASKDGTWADLLNASHWYASWFSSSKVKLSDRGFLLVCLNWRSLPTYLCAFSKCGWTATSCLVWNKDWIGPSYQNALRPTYELVLFAAMPQAVIPDRSASDVFTWKWMAGQVRNTGHPAEKPVELMQRLIELTTRSGDLVADWFFGSGTTGVACIQTGRRFIGIEIEPRYFDIACRRIRNAWENRQGKLF